MKEIQSGQFISKYLYNYLKVSLFLLAGTIFGVGTDMLADLICTSMVTAHLVRRCISITGLTARTLLS